MPPTGCLPHGVHLDRGTWGPELASELWVLGSDSGWASFELLMWIRGSDTDWVSARIWVQMWTEFALKFGVLTRAEFAMDLGF